MEQQDGNDYPNHQGPESNNTLSGRPIPEKKRHYNATRKRVNRRDSTIVEPEAKSRKMDENWTGVGTESESTDCVETTETRFTWFKAQTKHPGLAKSLQSEVTKVGLSIVDLQHCTLPCKSINYNFHFYSFKGLSREDSKKFEEMIDQNFVNNFCAENLLNKEDKNFFYYDLGYKQVVSLSMLATYFKIKNEQPLLHPLKMLLNKQLLKKAFEDADTHVELKKYLSKNGYSKLVQWMEEMTQ